ncbi:MAG: hypothetical protein WCH58_03835 [Candidatus Saccharibacteria bacterium]
MSSEVSNRLNYRDLKGPSFECLEDKYDNHIVQDSGLGNFAVEIAIDNAHVKLTQQTDDIEKLKDNAYSLDEYIRKARNTIKNDPYLASQYCDKYDISNNSPWLYRTISSKETILDKSGRFIEKIFGTSTKNIKLGKYAVDSFVLSDMSVTDRSVGEKVLEKLTKKNLLGKYIIDNATFLNFLEWYNYSHRQYNNDLSDTYNQKKAEYKDHIHDSVHEGWISEATLKSLNHIDDIRFTIDDCYHEGFVNSQSSAFVYDVIHKGRELHENVYFSGEKSVNVSSFHELNHVISTVEIIGNKIHRNGIRQIFGDCNGSTIINEAVTEHIAKSLTDKSYDIIDPSKKSGSYPEPRLLLHTLCEKGVKKIDIKDFINAYFELTEEDIEPGADSAAQKLKSSLKEAYPNIDIIDWIKRFPSIEAIRSHISKDGHLLTDLTLTERIQSYWNKLSSQIKFN